MNSFRSTNVAPGQKLSGRYQILSQLGQGGFGRTLLAKDLYLPGQPKCVVKQLQPSATDPDSLQVARRLFDTEAQILYKLGIHPQIPQLFAYFEENQEFYLVQEYIEGENLDRELHSKQRISEESVIDLLYEILEILAFVHQQNVIHRDVNPYNLIRRKEDGKLVLIDFGAVKQITTQMVQASEKNYTVPIGTPGYFPSEQAMGYPKLSSDIYAVGIIGIQALIGCLPEQIPSNSQTGEINWHSLIKVNPGLTYVLDMMVRYDFRDRYTSATEALEAVRKLRASNSKTIGGKMIAVSINKTVGGKTLVVGNNKSFSNFQIDLTRIRGWLAKGTIFMGIVGVGAAIFVGINHFLAANNATDLYRQGNILYELKDYDRALAAYEQALKIRPEYGEAWQGKGDVFQAQKRYKESLIAYEKAIQIQPNRWQPRLGRAQVLDKLGKNQEAIETYKKVIKIKPNLAEAWLGLAQVQMELNQYSEAIASYDRLLKMQPENSLAWYQQGWAWQNLREYEKAIKSYDKAVDIKPDLSSAWYQKGNVLMNLEKYEKAVEAYAKAVQFQPKLHQAWYSQGIALSKLGRNEEAIAAYSQATQVKSNYAQAWYQKGWMLHQLKRYEEAISAYDTVIRLRPSDYQAWYNKGNVLYNLGNYEGAIAAYKQTVAIERDYYQAWNSQGNALLLLKRYDEAVNAYDRALRYQPDYRQAQEGKAQAQSLLRLQQQKLQEQQENDNDEEKENEGIGNIEN
ncbi:MAG: tetratricopeptide repeat protein [Hydrococcus sp. C42_A2020_068]|nr:tetratricopeptide repeat protein [Hydrococcus sp. C42_A2020_068]